MTALRYWGVLGPNSRYGYCGVDELERNQPAIKMSGSTLVWRIMTDSFNPFKPPLPSRRAAIIIAAARKIIADSGSGMLTRKLLAERTGLKPAEVSREFPSKEALLRALASSPDDDPSKTVG